MAGLETSQLLETILERALLIRNTRKRVTAEIDGSRGERRCAVGSLDHGNCSPLSGSAESGSDTRCAATDDHTSSPHFSFLPRVIGLGQGYIGTRTLATEISDQKMFGLV